MKRVLVLFLFFFILLSSNVSAFVVNHTNLGQFDSLTIGQTDRVRELNYFFTHRSVGRIILRGMEDLALSNPKYSINIFPNPDVYPSTPTRQNYLDNGPMIGQMDHTQFFQQFFNFYGDNSDIIDVGFTKYCYVDMYSGETAQSRFNNYKTQVDAFKSSHPDSILIHFTMPLSITADSNGVERAKYRDLILSEYGGDYVFDIADFESWYNNEYTTFDYGDVTYIMMNSNHTYDDGHPDLELREDLAKGLWVMMSRVAEDLEEQNQMMGDVNGDENINVLDLSIVIFNQGRTLPDASYDHLDLDEDGDIDWQDVLIVLQNVV